MSRCRSSATITATLVHLHERDCSVQRRHQKVDRAWRPRRTSIQRQRDELGCIRTRCSLGQRRTGYQNAGTVEFLQDIGQRPSSTSSRSTPRLQVEHTVTETVITGVDLVQAQINVLPRAASDRLRAHRHTRGQDSIDPAERVTRSRVASRPRTPSNDFMPDYGHPSRSTAAASGFGIRLDAGNGLPGGARGDSPHYDSLAGQGDRFGAYDANPARRGAWKGVRALRGVSRIRGVKHESSQFLENVLLHETFAQRARTYDALHRRDARSCSRCRGKPRPRHAPAQLHRRRYREWQSGCRRP